MTASKLDRSTTLGQSSSNWNPEWETPVGGIPKSHYIDPQFADIEAEKLWPHVWQMACREEELPRPGDYTVYEIVDQSILIIRTDENEIKAYHNVCPHRATALATGSGRFSTGEITCPFHGWRWNLNGDSTFVLDKGEFKGGCLSDEDVGLRECQVATWIGCVFINMDKDAPSFEQHISPIRQWIDPFGFENMKFYWWKSIEVPANWKIAQEAFHEAYHVGETHPQLDPRRGGRGNLRHETFDYFAYENGHGRYLNTAGKPAADDHRMPVQDLSHEEQVDALIDGMELSEGGMDAMVLMEEVILAKSMRHRAIPQGSSVAEEFGRVVREHYANRGRWIPTPDALKEVNNAFIFPNYTFLPSMGNVLIYRSRPTRDNDPDKCIFELWSCRSYGDNETPPRPQCQHMTDGLNPEQYRLIPRQDFSNIPRIQRGLHSRGFDSSMLSDRQEIWLTNMHKELERYLKA